MGAKTDLASDPRQRQMAREGMRMRQERIRQRREQGEGNQAGEASFFPGMAPPSSPVARQEQDNVGSEFEQMLRRIRRG